jgi:hypothetical protein
MVDLSRTNRDHAKEYNCGGGGNVDLKGIKSEDMSVQDLLTKHYVIPDYQREYVWEQSQVERLLDDINSEFAERTSQYTPDYFIGTLVTYHDENRKIFELVDGQQRVTTIYVILSAIQDFRATLGEPSEILKGCLVSFAKVKGKEVPLHRVQLQYEDSQDVVKKLVDGRLKYPIDKIEESASTRSARNLVKAYHQAAFFLAETLGGDAKKIDDFQSFLLDNVKLIRITTSNRSKSLWIFETINQRGKSLDAFDLLKNMLFREARDDQFETLKRRWKSLADTLYRADENPMRFIRYYILANYAKQKLTADQVYDWFTNSASGKRPAEQRPDYKSDPISFAETLLKAAKAYVNFATGRLESGKHCRYLMNMGHMSQTARQHLILMLAARNLSESAQAALAREIERLYFVFLLTGQSPNKFEQDFVGWAQELREMTTDTQLHDFLDDRIQKQLSALEIDFEHSMTNLSELNMPKYRLKYVLAKLTQHLDEIAYEKRELNSYLDPKVEIEHILSVGSTPEVVTHFGGDDAAASSMRLLGNLTLLEKSINASIGNDDFPSKRREYVKSKMLLTKSLHPRAAMGKDTAVNRALELVSPYEQWTKREFEDRTTKLVALSKKIWLVVASTS